MTDAVFFDEEEEDFDDEMGVSLPNAIAAKRLRPFAGFFKAFIDSWYSGLTQDSYDVAADADFAREIHFFDACEDADESLVFEPPETVEDNLGNYIQGEYTVAWVRRLFYLQFTEDSVAQSFWAAKKAKTSSSLFSRSVDAIVWFTGRLAGVGEIFFHGLRHFSFKLIDTLDQHITKPIMLNARKWLSSIFPKVEYRKDYYKGHNTSIATLPKMLIAVFLLPLHALWHFAFSKDISMVEHADSRVGKVLWVLGLITVSVAVIFLTGGFGTAPAVAAVMAKFNFIQVAGDAVAVLVSSAFADTIAFAAQAVFMYAIWKSLASIFMKALCYIPILGEHFAAEKHNAAVDLAEEESIAKTKAKLITQLEAVKCLERAKKSLKAAHEASQFGQEQILRHALIGTRENLSGSGSSEAGVDVSLSTLPRLHSDAPALYAITGILPETTFSQNKSIVIGREGAQRCGVEEKWEPEEHWVRSRSTSVVA